jgi:hypothetical protein
MKLLICVFSLLMSFVTYADSNNDMLTYIQNDYEDDLSELLSHPDKNFDINFK